MGFTIGEIATKALEGVTGPYTIASVSAALEGVSNYNTGMLCQGYTYGNYPEHIPNNMDYTVTPPGQRPVRAGLHRWRVHPDLGRRPADRRLTWPSCGTAPMVG